MSEEYKSLFVNRPYYKPFNYPKYYSYWKTQELMFWLPFEVDMSKDLTDFSIRISNDERIFLTNLLRFFTQTDVEVSKSYIRLLNLIQQIEVQMMLISFMHMESIHIAAYEHLVNSLNLPEKEYKAFLEYKEIKDKYDYLQNFNTDNEYNLLRSIGIFNGFVEGFVLFSSFCMLLSFTRFGLFSGLGQIISMSMKDEFLHAQGMADLYNDIYAEIHSRIDAVKLNRELDEAHKILLEMEIAFIKSAFTHPEEGRKLIIRGINEEEVLYYVKYLSNTRRVKLNLSSIKEYEEIRSNIPKWMLELGGLSELINFFNNKGSEYARTEGWGDIE